MQIRTVESNLKQKYNKPWINRVSNYSNSINLEILLAFTLILLLLGGGYEPLFIIEILIFYILK